jgi:NADH:ubiquinone reductase (non-electrogenic)
LTHPESSTSHAAVATACTVELRSVDNNTTQSTADLVLWSAGASPATKNDERRLGLPFPTNSRGAIKTVCTLTLFYHQPFEIELLFASNCDLTFKTMQDPTLRVQNQKSVFALGDLSVTSLEDGQKDQQDFSGSSSFPATAQVAFQQADYVAWNLWASINGRTLLPFRYEKNHFNVHDN